MPASDRSRARLAVIAFAFHSPGLWVLARAKQNRATWGYNAVAIAATVAAMVVAGVATHRALAVGAAWAACHAVWGACLAHRVLTGRALA